MTIENDCAPAGRPEAIAKQKQGETDPSPVRDQVINGCELVFPVVCAGVIMKIPPQAKGAREIWTCDPSSRYPAIRLRKS